MELLGFDLSSFSHNAQLTICVSSVFTFHLLYGYALEFLFKVSELKSYGWFVTCVQFGLYALFGFTEGQIRNIGARRAPWMTYLFLGFLSVGTIGFSNTSLLYLNYPTQVIFKCCKLIPVMIGGVIIQNKQYSVLEYLAVSLMTFGLVVFSLADTSVSPNFDVTGIVMICIALLFDAVIGNYQEKTIKQYESPNIEVVCLGSAAGFLLLLVGCVATGELMPAIQEVIKSTASAHLALIVLSVTGYFGIQVVLCLIRHFGALVAVMATTFRKILSVAISFIFFSKPFTPTYLAGGLLVFAGVYLNTLIKSKKLTFDSISSSFADWRESICGKTKKKIVFEV